MCQNMKLYLAMIKMKPAMIKMDSLFPGLISNDKFVGAIFLNRVV